MSEHWEIIEKDYGTHLVLLHDWDLDIANQFLGFVETSFDAKKHKNFVFDLHHVNHIDSMVIGIIISISKKIKAQGGMVFLLKPSSQVEKLLQDIGLLSFFNLEHTEPEIQSAIEKNK